MTRLDPHMTRARELALAAGIDPDSRVGEGRGRPAWCDFRDAARAEQVASDANALSHNLPEQSAAYANAPLAIFGEHEPNTILQMQNCMRVGDVVGGVIWQTAIWVMRSRLAGSSRTRSRFQSAAWASTSGAATWRCVLMCRTMPFGNA